MNKKKLYKEVTLGENVGFVPTKQKETPQPDNIVLASWDNDVVDTENIGEIYNDEIEPVMLKSMSAMPKVPTTAKGGAVKPTWIVKKDGAIQTADEMNNIASAIITNADALDALTETVSKFDSSILRIDDTVEEVKTKVDSVLTPKINEIATAEKALETKVEKNTKDIYDITSGGGTQHVHTNLSTLETFSVKDGYLLCNAVKIKAGYADNGGGGGEDYFLSKIKDDTTKGKLTVDGGVVTDKVTSKNYTAGPLGAGFDCSVDANGISTLTVDKLTARLNATFNKLTIAEIQSVGGQIIVSPANLQCTKVERKGTRYRCYFDTQDGKIANTWALNDQARCQTWGTTPKYYWRLVLGVGADYIDLSDVDLDGTGIPEAKDSIVQLGNRTDVNRQNAIVISSTGDNSPSFTQYAGIHSYTLSGCETTVLSPKGNKLVGDLSITRGNTIVKIPKDILYTPGQECTYYDRVSYNGSLWLCIVREGTTTKEIPSDTSEAWTKVVDKGRDGVNGKDGTAGTPGAPGADGKPTYFHTAYADDDKGTGFSQTSDGKYYMGTYSDNIETDSTDPTKYTWVKIKGEPGKDAAKSLIDWQTDWKLGSEELPNWDSASYGGPLKNERRITRNPAGLESMIWAASFKEDGNQYQGGFKTPEIMALDPKFSYRYCVFVYSPYGNSNDTYIGASGGLKAVTGRNKGFFVNRFMSANTWNLFVGIIQASTATVESSITGIYEMSGVKIQNGYDMKHGTLDTPSNVTFETYVKGTSSLTHQYQASYFYSPMLHKIDGTEPSIEEIIQLSTRAEIDSVKTTYDAKFIATDKKIESNMSASTTYADTAANKALEAAKLSASQTYSTISQTAGQISLAVTETKTYAAEKATTAEKNAKDYTTTNFASTTYTNNLISQCVSSTDYNGTTMVSKINQTSDAIKLSANKITLEGIITNGNNFKVLQDGSIEANNAKFSGAIHTPFKDIITTVSSGGVDLNFDDIYNANLIVNGDVPAGQQLTICVNLPLNPNYNGRSCMIYNGNVFKNGLHIEIRSDVKEGNTIYTEWYFELKSRRMACVTCIGGRWVLTNGDATYFR